LITLCRIGGSGGGRSRASAPGADGVGGQDAASDDARPGDGRPDWALPSHTTRAWKEQFGRVLIEAMSCGVPVVGSSSGEIPNVIGDAGLIYPEGDVRALATTLQRLAEQPELYADLARRGRARVLERYTQAALARQYYEVYRSMLKHES